MSDEQTIDLSTDGFTSLTHPGPVFRPIPEFTFDIPPNWIAGEYPDSLCIIGTPAESPEPWSNVFLKHERVLRTTALEEVALQSWEDLKAAFPDAEAKEEHLVGFEQFHYVRESELTLLGEKVKRIDSYFFGPDVDHATVDLFHFIFTHPVAAGDDRTVLYMKMLSSFSFA